jgi:hypothetical protein
MRKLLLLMSIIVLISLPKNSRADDEGASHPGERPHYWKSVFVIGSSFSGKTSYQIGTDSGTLLGTDSDRANAYLSIAGELTFQTEFPLGVSFIVEGTRYAYTVGGPTDGEFGLYGMPRLAQRFGALELWAGVGLGVMFTNIGGASSGTVDGVNLTLNTMSPTGFAWSPRVGVDIDVNPHTFFGAQLSYTSTQLSVPFTAIYDGQTIDGKEDATRSWLAASFRVGTRF